jgi:glycyl-tRNA synthetase beta chain
MSASHPTTFLLEVGTEEIPDRMLAAGVAALRQQLEVALQPLQILAPDAAWSTWCTPRRLAVAVGPVLPRQEDREEEVTGPPVRAAFDAQGKPTKALEGFARGHGLTPEQVQRVQTPKGEYMGFQRSVTGRGAAELLAEAVAEVLPGLHFPKMMRWGSGSFRFVRPIRWIVALLGEETVSVEIAGVNSGRHSQGHRTLSSAPVRVNSPEGYVEALRGAGVLVDPQERHAAIQEGLARAVVETGGEPLPDESLLHSLVAMTEWPAVITGSFAPEFLELPREVLVTAMRFHQHYFSVVRPGSDQQEPELLPAFLAVINQDGDSSGNIRRGNEWVLKARLADARFFWQEDRKRPLESRLPDLERVIFQEKLGSYRNKVDRMVRLVNTLGSRLELDATLVSHAARAALLSKCDLTTEMVGEFPELQGVMGGLYARSDGEAPHTAEAVYDHYRPVAAGDELPRGPAGCLLALADRLDTLAGYFLIGAEPTGARDPFALRRAGTGVVRILMAEPWYVPLAEAVQEAVRGYSGVGDADDAVQRLQRFFAERTRQALQAAGHRYDSVSAVLAVPYLGLRDAAARLDALTRLRAEPELEEAFLSLAAAHKRIRNLVQADGHETVDAGSLQETPEIELHRCLQEAHREMEKHLEVREYLPALKAVARLRTALDGFLGASRDEGVLVMSPDPRLRQNRLGLLRRAGELFSLLADFSEIVVEGETTSEKRKSTA